MRNSTKLLIVTLTVIIVWMGITIFEGHAGPKPVLTVPRASYITLFQNGDIGLVRLAYENGDYNGFFVYSRTGKELWNITFGRRLTWWDSIIAAEVSPDGKYLALLTGKKLFLLDENGTPLWNVTLNQRDLCWPCSGRLAFSPDSKVVAFAMSSHFGAYLINGTPLVDQLSSGETVRAIAVTNDGLYVAVQSTINSTSGVRAYIFNGSKWSFFTHEGAARGITAFENSNGTWVAFADCEGGLYLFHNGKLMWHREGCYWDVAFWKGRVYGACNGVDIYSLNGTPIDSMLHQVNIFTLVSTPSKLVLFEEDTFNGQTSMGVYVFNGTRVKRIMKVNGFPVKDSVSHVIVDFRNDKLIFGISNEERTEIYLIAFNSG